MSTTRREFLAMPALLAAAPDSQAVSPPAHGISHRLIVGVMAAWP